MYIGRKKLNNRTAAAEEEFKKKTFWICYHNYYLESYEWLY